MRKLLFWSGASLLLAFSVPASPASLKLFAHSPGVTGCGNSADFSSSCNSQYLVIL